MWRHLHHAGRHLIADLPYTLSTMRNNHLLGDALGLIALGRAFGGKTGERWYAIGNRIFNRQLARHMRPDGSMIEDSVSYHRFVLEMLSMRVVLGGAPPTCTTRWSDAAQFLARLGVLDGPVPQYGDWDEGRVFAVADDPARTGRLGPSRPRSRRERCPRRRGERTARRGGMVRRRRRAEATGGRRDLGNDIGAGIGRAHVGPFTVWLKAGSGPSHGHADLSSVAIAVGDQWLVGDPGTATYNGPIESGTGSVRPRLTMSCALKVTTNSSRIGYSDGSTAPAVYSANRSSPTIRSPCGVPTMPMRDSIRRATWRGLCR